MLSVGDLSQGLQHAEDLDAGFTESAVLPDSAVADAASVAEATLRGFGSLSDPEVVVLEEGFTPSSASPPIDLRFNQLDELDSQNSSSILSNCGSGEAPPDGEFAYCSQISNVSNLSCGNVSVVNLSPSILPNCGSVGAPSDGEFVNCSQIDQSNSSVPKGNSDNVINPSKDNVNC